MAPVRASSGWFILRAKPCQACGGFLLIVVFCNVGPDQCLDVSGLVGYAVELVDDVGFSTLHCLKMILYRIFFLPYFMGAGLFFYCFFASCRL